MGGPPDTTGKLRRFLIGSGLGISLNIPGVLLEGASGAIGEEPGYGAGLGELGLPSLEKGKFREDPRSIFQCPKGWEKLGTKTRNGRKRGNGFKLEKGRFRWEIGKKFLQGNAGASRPRQQEHPEMLQNMEYPT